jgi:ketoreductase RED1
MAETPTKLAVVGAGVIGISWARLARDHGWTVSISDPRPDLQTVVEQAFGSGADGVSFTSDLATAVAGADLVQENGPERLDVKQGLFAEIIAAAPAHAVLASSSSSIGATLIAQGLEDGARVVVGHPFNPPELMPLVEVVPGERTSEATVQRAVELYTSLDRKPVVIRKELPGFVVNRLQVAISREAQYLVQQGVVGVHDLDVALQGSLGLRWATIGLFEGNALGGGPGGASHLFAGVGAETSLIQLGTPAGDAESMAALAGEIDKTYGTGEENYERMLERRDRRTHAVLDALKQNP